MMPLGLARDPRGGGLLSGEGFTGNGSGLRGAGGVSETVEHFRCDRFRHGLRLPAELVRLTPGVSLTSGQPRVFERAGVNLLWSKPAAPGGLPDPLLP